MCKWCASSAVLVVSFGALFAAVPARIAAAQDASNPTNAGITLPEMQVIATSPVAPPKKRAPSVRGSSTAGQAPAQAQGQPQLEGPASPQQPGVVERDKIPANVQVLQAPAFDQSRAPNLLDALGLSLPGVALSDQTGNEFQPDLNYRGFVASPVIGTPQGLAVYQNGVRINEVFGDIVNWDFIPQNAIDHMTLVPSNPIYGLNAIGGALSFDMKNGYTSHGVSGEVSAGSYGRATASVQAGGQNGNFSGYITVAATDDAGWRQASPSQVRRVYADLGARGDNNTEFHLTFTGADNHFGATAATPIEMLSQDWSSIYTIPQTTHNQLAFTTASASWTPRDTLTVQGNLYYRDYWQSHVDGNNTSASNDPTVCPDPTLLCFPNLDRTYSNLITTSGSTVPNTSELGTVNADQFPLVVGTGIFIDQPSGDLAPVRLGATTLYTGLYTTDTFDITQRLAVTAGARFNTANIVLTDEIGNDPGLNG